MPRNLNPLTSLGRNDKRGREFAELVAKIVAEIEDTTLIDERTYFGRLIYFASLRDNSTGWYSHEGIMVKYSNEEAMNEALGICHARSFAAFVRLPLEEQTREVAEVLHSHGGVTQEVAKTWRRLRSFEILPPEKCHQIEHDLFSRNIEIILKLLQRNFKKDSAR